LALPIANANEVVVEGGGIWADGQFCFMAEPGMFYSFTVNASNACGAATCAFTYNVDSYDDPVACFTADPTEGPVPLDVTFTNCSDIDTDGATYLWDFDDGTTSADMNPAVHTYDQIGCYEVSLTVTDDCGRTNMAMQTICVTDDQVVIPTDRWINIYCPEPMLEGVPLSPGDMITAYDPDGVLCGMGEVQPDGSYGMILIYADDIYTADVDEGAEVGDLISIHINGVPVATDPTIIWTENGAVFMVCSFTAETCVTFDLDAGWHLISWNVAYSADIAEAIDGIVECVDVVLSFDRGGLTYDPTLPEYSTLMGVDFYHGYWLRLSCPVSFDVCGGIISPNDYIQVYSGWNLVSYWPTDILPVQDALASLLVDDNLLVAYGWHGGGAVDFIPGDAMHQSLTELMPGYGYWAKVKFDAMLTYPGFNPPPAAPRLDNQRSLATSVGVTPSRDWMSIYGSNLEVDGEPVRSGATVEVFTDDGVLCGSGAYNDGILKFTAVYGLDGENETSANYPKTDEQLNVRIDGVAVASDLTYRGGGSRVSLGSLSAADLLPDAYSVSQNYPNPFNPSTTIAFNLPTAGQVELSVFNVLGQKVATIANGQFTAGSHEVTWNGTDENGTSVGSGIYFYRIQSADFDQTKKMILMK
jgi:PKD repeat protein